MLQDYNMGTVMMVDPTLPIFQHEIRKASCFMAPAERRVANTTIYAQSNNILYGKKTKENKIDLDDKIDDEY